MGRGFLEEEAHMPDLEGYRRVVIVGRMERMCSEPRDLHAGGHGGVNSEGAGRLEVSRGI